MLKFGDAPTSAARPVRCRNQMKYLLAGFVLVLFGVYHLSGFLRVSHLCVSQSSKQVAKDPGEIIWEPCPGDEYAGLDCGSVV